MTVSFDTSHLIAEMEARPILWDASSKISYQNRDKVKEAWFDLAKAVIPDFDYMKYAKQCEFLEQMKRKYYKVRAAYRAALIKGEPYEGPRLTFLDRVFKFPPGGESSTEVDESNVKEVQKNPKEEPTTENTQSSSINHLEPILSIRKIDAAPVMRSGRGRKRRGRGRPKFQRLVLPETKATEPIVHQEQQSIVSEDESKEDGGSVKRCKYQCDVQMAATRTSTPPRRSSPYASLSFDDDRQSAERRIVPSRHFDSYNAKSSHHNAYNDRSSYNCDSRNGRSHNYEIYPDRPVRERNYSPTSSPMRRQESYFDPHRYPMIPTIPLDYQDDDMAFFRSLLTWTKRFSEDEKLEFRSEVMKLVSRIRNSESSGNYYVISQTPLS